MHRSKRPAQAAREPVFRFVAQEVKSLSKETDSAVQKIEASVAAIDTTSKEISERIHELETASEDIKQTISQFDTQIQENAGSKHRDFNPCGEQHGQRLYELG